MKLRRLYEGPVQWSLNRLLRLPHKYQHVLVTNYMSMVNSFKYLKYAGKDLSRILMTGQCVKIDTASVCQLKCPICPTGTGENRNGPIGWGYLKFKDFKNFVDDNPGVKIIELSCWGEMFLNPELLDIIVYAHEKGISLKALNGVNLNTVKREVLESLVKYRFRMMNIAIDGVTEETYQKYRVGGSLERVLENVRLINEYKKKYKSLYPVLTWQFLLMGHNEHELPGAIRMARDLNMIFFPKLNWDPDYSPIKDREYVRREAGLSVVTREEYREKYNRTYIYPCIQLWGAPQINWDGKLMGCCKNRWGDFGNVFEEGFEECMTGERYVSIKRMLLGYEKPVGDNPCKQCPLYPDILENPVTRQNIFLHQL